MAEAKTSMTTERKGELARRESYYPTHDLFTMNPFTLMRRLSDEMDRAFASSFGLSRGTGESGTWLPAVEVKERGNNLVVIAELPGLNKEDVKVECTQDGLVIEGERRREHTEEHGGMWRSERSYGRFHRSIPLPEGAEVDKAKAEFKNGVLEVTVPVPESSRRSRQIPIGG